jgi:hypothetical protein
LPLASSLGRPSDFRNSVFEFESSLFASLADAFSRGDKARLESLWAGAEPLSDQLQAVP